MNRCLTTLYVLCAWTLPLVSIAASGKGELLVGNKSDDTVWRLDLADGRRLGEPVATVALAEPEARYRETMLGRAALPIGVIAGPDGARVYVAVSGGNEIAVVDRRTWQVVERWKTGNEPDALGIVAGHRGSD
ncbi:YncE family protein [Luteimonas salinilitoris]|uniref:YncE family protein n=1 Tax=Luteimonas salinilitoris TaxID=3237697 RepID=A0ABV4HT33_9GAMM